MKFLLFVLLITQLSFVSYAANEINKQTALPHTTAIKDFFIKSDYANFTVSPSGDFVAFVKKSPGKYSIFVVNVNSGTEFEILTAEQFSVEHVRHENYIRTIKHNNEITDITWLGSDIIAVRENSKHRFRRFKIIKLELDQDDVSVDKVSYLNHEGYWIDPVISSNSRAIFAKYKDNDDNDLGYHVDLYQLQLKKKN